MYIEGINYLDKQTTKTEKRSRHVIFCCAVNQRTISSISRRAIDFLSSIVKNYGFKNYEIPNHFILYFKLVLSSTWLIGLEREKAKSMHYF